MTLTPPDWRNAWPWRARWPHLDDAPDGPAHDGDTITLALDRGLDGTATTPEDGFRLKGVRCPERGERGYEDCRVEAVMWLANHDIPGARWPFLVFTERTSTDANSRKTLGRYVATVYGIHDPISLNDHMTVFVRSRGYPLGK